MSSTHVRSFAVLGLGTMGRNLALNVLDHGFPIAAYNRSEPGRAAFSSELDGRDALVTGDLKELVAQLERPRQLLLMVPAGDVVDAVIEELAPLLDQDDIIIDGGNSWYEDTERRGPALAARGLRFLGVGISGGEEGARYGPSLMPGGDPDAYRALAPLLEAISAKTEAGPCVTHVGPGGSGHFVKMVHNGIEYADMQLIAEAHDLMRRGQGREVADIADTFEAWNGGALRSFLVEITVPILRQLDTDGTPLVERVLDRAGQKGTGRWTASIALELGVAIPSIAAAVDARVLSSAKQDRVQAEALLGPLEFEAGPELAVEDLESALLLAKSCAYAQGFDLIRTGSERFDWGVDLVETARIWKGGCIIRARLLDDIREAFGAPLDHRNLLLTPAFRDQVQRCHPGLRRTVAFAVSKGIPVPAFAASLAYLDALRTGRLPQNLTQAQRDAFGAHTYQRTDDADGPAVHSDWLG